MEAEPLIALEIFELHNRDHTLERFNQLGDDQTELVILVKDSQGRHSLVKLEYSTYCLTRSEIPCYPMSLLKTIETITEKWEWDFNGTSLIASLYDHIYKDYCMRVYNESAKRISKLPLPPELIDLSLLRYDSPLIRENCIVHVRSSAPDWYSFILDGVNPRIIRDQILNIPISFTAPVPKSTWIYTVTRVGNGYSTKVDIKQGTI